MRRFLRLGTWDKGSEAGTPPAGSVTDDSRHGARSLLTHDAQALLPTPASAPSAARSISTNGGPTAAANGTRDAPHAAEGDAAALPPLASLPGAHQRKPSDSSSLTAPPAARAEFYSAGDAGAGPGATLPGPPLDRDPFEDDEDEALLQYRRDEPPEVRSRSTGAATACPRYASPPPCSRAPVTSQSMCPSLGRVGHIIHDVTHTCRSGQQGSGCSTWASTRRTTTTRQSPTSTGSCCSPPPR